MNKVNRCLVSRWISAGSGEQQQHVTNQRWTNKQFFDALLGVIQFLDRKSEPLCNKDARTKLNGHTSFFILPSLMIKPNPIEVVA